MADETTQSGGPSKLWRSILVCSLALNLAVVGIVGGSFASGRLGDGPPRSFDLGIGPVSRALSEEERREVGQVLRRDRNLRGIDLRARAERMIATLKADPFLPDAFRTELEMQASQHKDVQDRARDAFVAAIVAMTPERRAAFADQLAEEMSKDRPKAPRTSSGG